MNAIFAVDVLGGFGENGDMPWPRCPEDLKRFKQYTDGATVVMGRGTWESNMPKPLPNRRNIVLSTTMSPDSRCELFTSVTGMMMDLKKDERVFVIGGVKTLWLLRGYIDTVYLTRFDLVTKSTVIMNTTQYLAGFKLEDSTKLSDHTFEIWTKLAVKL